MSIIYYIIISLIYLIIRLELDPKLGNIWIRPNEKNKLIFCPGSIFELFKSPFYNLYLWYPKLWCINPYIVMIVFVSFFYIIFE